MRFGHNCWKAQIDKKSLIGHSLFEAQYAVMGSMHASQLMGNGVKVDIFILFVPFNFRLPVPRHEPKHVLNPSIVRDLNWYLHNYHNNSTNINSITKNTQQHQNKQMYEGIYLPPSLHQSLNLNTASIAPLSVVRGLSRNKGMRLRPTSHPCTQHVSFRQRGNKKKIRLLRITGDLFFHGLSNTFLVNLEEYRNLVLYVLPLRGEV